MAEQNGKNVGRIEEIQSVVIECVFPEKLPEIYNAIEIDMPARDGSESTRLVAEVQQHLGDDRVRAVAMDSTDGLARGQQVVDTGGPITVPGRRADARPALQPARRADRRRRPGGGRRSAGRSTATPPTSRT